MNDSTLEARLERALKPAKLSRHMLSALDMIVRHGGEVVALRGGFWTWPGATTNDEGTPEWWVGTTTIRALATRGMLALRTVPPRTFASNGTVTAAGRSRLSVWGVWCHQLARWDETFGKSGDEAWAVGAATRCNAGTVLGNHYEARPR